MVRGLCFGGRASFMGDFCVGWVGVLLWDCGVYVCVREWLCVSCFCIRLFFFF